MTCIVGLVDGGSVWIGGDSAGVDGHFSLRVRRDPKVFVNEGFIFGFTSSFRMGQVLAHSFSPPKQKVGQDPYAFMVTDFVDGVRQTLKNAGYARAKDGEESGGTFLVGHAGRLFAIHDDYQVGETDDGFDAVGSGADVALGALHASMGEPGDRLRAALAAAERFNAAVRRPFLVKQLAAA
jgi:ATP-dependent protease HslVU (ClpYQ) peptidase subunit